MTDLYPATLHPSQTAVSFASNLAAVNGALTMRDFCRHMCLLESGPALPVRLNLLRLAELGNVDAKQLMAQNIERTDNKALVKFGAEELSYKSMSFGRFRYCPHCVLDDVANGSGEEHARSFMRAEWHVLSIQTCVIHNAPLVTSKRPHDTYINGDFAGYLRNNLDEVQRFELLERPAAPLSVSDAYQHHRLRGCRLHPFLDSLKYYVAVDLSEVVGGIRLFGPTCRPHALSADDLQKARECGFEVTLAGIERFRAFLSELSSNFWESRKPYGGSQIYGFLYNWLRSNRHDPGVMPLGKLVQSHAVETLPLGPRDSFLYDIEERKLHSIHSAAKEYQLHPQTMRKLLAAKNLIAADHAERADARVVADAKAVSALFEELKDFISLGTAATRLDVSHAVLTDLIEDGLVRVINRDDVHGSLRPGCSRAEIEALLERLLAGAEPQTDTMTLFDPDMVTIDRAVRQAHCAFREIIRLLARGELKRVVRIGDALELNSLVVSLNEVRSKTALPDHGCIKLRDVELRLGTTTKTVQALLTFGHLPFKTETNPHNRCPQQVVHPADLENFIKTYVSLHSLAIEHSVPIANMRKNLADRGVEPAIELGGRLARFYERDSVRVALRAC